MAWMKAHIEIKPASVGTGIKCQLRQTRKSAALLSFTVNGSVGKDIGLGDGDKVEIMIGDGEHHGLIRLRKNNSAGQAEVISRTTGKGEFFLIRLGHQGAFVDRSEPPSWCQWEKVEDGWVEIVLPKWADETSSRKRTEAPASKPSLATQPRPGGRNVTASLMGDPPPGRREMLEKIGSVKA